MTLFKMVNAERVQMSPEEEKQQLQKWEASRQEKQQYMDKIDRDRADKASRLERLKIKLGMTDDEMDLLKNDYLITLKRRGSSKA